MNALIAEGMHPAGEAVLRRAGWRLFEPGGCDQPQEMDALIVRSVFRVDGTALERFPRLSAVAKLGTGLDNIDLSACKYRGVRVINAAGMNALSTAEFGLMQILSHYKNKSRIDAAVKRRDFRRAEYFGRELSGLTVGVIGYGSVGQHLVRLLEPVVAKILVSSNRKPLKEPTDQCHFVMSLDLLLKEAEVIVLALSLAGNELMINQDFLAQVKPDAVFINMARGGLVDEPALVKFLQSHPQAYYYCDVIEPEPDYTLPPGRQSFDHPLLKVPNTIYTPHIAGMTRECQEKIAIKVAEELISLSKEIVHGR